MKRQIKTCFFLILLPCLYSFGQIGQYNFKRELKGISGQWHTVVLPNEIFGKVSQNLSDIRIIGITTSKDTVEAPYLLQLRTEKIIANEIAYNILNASHNEDGYYFTFEIPTTEPINHIKLDFNRENFDWRIKLEGSQNQEDWFTIIENYRILSIKNELTDFQFTTLTFPVSKYRFFRLRIDSKEIPYLTVANMAKIEITEGTFRNYSVRKINTKNNKETRQTEIDIDLEKPVPVSYIKIGVSDTFDYYRAVTIKYLADSLNTEQGWIYDYRTLTSGTLNSIDENEFTFNSTTVQRLKIFIHNHDNQHLLMDTIQVRGYLHELVVRFTEPATYYLTYGNKNTAKPHYDINRFTEKVPETRPVLGLGDELPIKKEEASLADPLFKNMTWLWTVMILIILLLGWFSVKMIRKN